MGGAGDAEAPGVSGFGLGPSSTAGTVGWAVGSTLGNTTSPPIVGEVVGKAVGGAVPEAVGEERSWGAPQATTAAARARTPVSNTMPRPACRAGPGTVPVTVPSGYFGPIFPIFWSRALISRRSLTQTSLRPRKRLRGGGNPPAPLEGRARHEQRGSHQDDTEPADRPVQGYH